MQRSGRLVKDRSGCRVDVMAAFGASPRLPLLRSLVPFERRLLVVLGAVSLVVVNGVTSVPEPVETCGVVGEVGHELHQRILGV